jgi:hypothetical protein
MDKIWYYMKEDRTKYGPYTDRELANLISNKILTEDDYIWMPDLPNWIRLGDSIYSYYLKESSEFDNDFNI